MKELTTVLIMILLVAVVLKVPASATPPSEVSDTYAMSAPTGEQRTAQALTETERAAKLAARSAFLNPSAVPFLCASCPQ